MDQEAGFQELIRQGLTASGDNRVDAALALFTQASAMQPVSGLPHFLIGSEHAAAGHMERAEAAFANAVLLAPDFTLARYQLGLLQFCTHRPAVALVTWGPLFALPPSASLGEFVRGFAAVTQDDFQRALQHFAAGQSCEDANPAVAADIRLMVQGLESLLSPEAETPTPEPEQQHVLLSAYGRGLH